MSQNDFAGVEFRKIANEWLFFGWKPTYYTTCSANYVIPPPMLPKDYTADAICRVMNLSGFIDPAWSECEYPTLRIVLTPSFHPEVCITITRRDDGALFSIVALAEQFWARFPAAVTSSSLEEISVSTGEFEGWLKLFKIASTPMETTGRVVVIDGMGLECCLVSRDGVRRFSAHASEPATNSFLAAILDAGWNNFQNPKVRNGLAAAAGYVNLRFPVQEVPAELPVTRIAILGNSQAREDYFEMLKRMKDTGRE